MMSMALQELSFSVKRSGSGERRPRGGCRCLRFLHERSPGGCRSIRVASTCFLCLRGSLTARKHIDGKLQSPAASRRPLWGKHIDLASAMDVAEAMLGDVMGDHYALCFANDYAAEVLAKIDYSCFRISAKEIEQWREAREW